MTIYKIEFGHTIDRQNDNRHDYRQNDYRHIEYSQNDC